MSGEDEILPWSVEHFDPQFYEYFDDWLNDVRNQFENDGRLPLEEILSKGGLDAMKQIWEISVSISILEDELRKETIQRILDEFV